METGSGSREGVLLSHEQFVCFQLSMGCWRPRAVPFVTGVLGLPGAWLRECLLPTVDQEIRVSDNQIGVGLARLHEQDVGPSRLPL